MTKKLSDRIREIEAGPWAIVVPTLIVEIEKLEQQLAIIVEQNNTLASRVHELRHGRDELRQQVTLLQDALEGLVAWANDLRRSDPVEDLRKAREALAATKEN
jgi:predicted  nucleic acid-binding Zn-ribbon protein